VTAIFVDNHILFLWCFQDCGGCGCTNKYPTIFVR